MKIVFCGVGALGSTAAVLCRNLDANLMFIDFDRVESKNLQAQSFVKQSLGKNKAAALKLQLQNFYGIKTDAATVRITADNVEALLSDADLLVDAMDNIKSRLLVSEFAKTADKPLVHAAISADGTFGMVRWDERFAPDAEDEEGQATCEGGQFLPFIGLVSSALARAIQDYVEKDVQRDSIVSLSAVTKTAD